MVSCSNGSLPRQMYLRIESIFTGSQRTGPERKLLSRSQGLHFFMLCRFTLTVYALTAISFLRINFIFVFFVCVFLLLILICCISEFEFNTSNEIYSTCWNLDFQNIALQLHFDNGTIVKFEGA